MQLKKLSVLCNGCFWLTLLFEVWKPARNLQQDLLNTIVMLGLIAIAINLVWVISLFVKKTKKTPGMQAGSIPGMKKIETNSNQTAGLLFRWFNLISFAAQLIFLYFKFL
ncbi:hypothetical protein BH10BAC3_BH10BAC3_12590 [soil metagenome]